MPLNIVIEGDSESGEIEDQEERDGTVASGNRRGKGVLQRSFSFYLVTLQLDVLDSSMLAPTLLNKTILIVILRAPGLMKMRTR